LSVALL